MNQFTDWTDAERMAMNGYDRSLGYARTGNGVNEATGLPLSFEAEENVDWRDASMDTAQ